MVVILSGCASTVANLPSAGPSVKQVRRSSIPIIDVDDAVARRIVAAQRRQTFSATLASANHAASYVVGAGDTVSVTVWEAPPAALFGSNLGASNGTSNAQMVTIPDQSVAADGTIVMPFAGPIQAAGHSPKEIEAEIARELDGKANHLQALVRVTRNVTSNVTVMGEVGASALVPLTDKGERLLDALAMVGGVRGSVDKESIQINRGSRVSTMPLQKVMQDPNQNIYLQPGDVVTALSQSNSFTVLGAAGRNAEINFESFGISLAQALGRIGGIQDTAADAKGLFLFRFENPAALPSADQAFPHTPEGKVPVIYQVNLNNPATFLVAQNFPINDKDVIYVSTAGAVELQKFLNILAPSLSAAAVLITVSP